MTKIQVVQGDITQEDVDAIVNAAHEGLTSGGGVDGAIHRAAGSQLLGECLNLHGCEIGQARITSGYDLKARYVIHTVGPTWRGGLHNEAEDLTSCYNHCLMLASLQGLHSISFPCLSTGAFVFPKDKAAEIAVQATRNILNRVSSSLKQVRFVCFDEENLQEYLALLPGGEQEFTPEEKSKLTPEEEAAMWKVVRPLLKYINETPGLLSVLYDMDLMPEQVKAGSQNWKRMVILAEAWQNETKAVTV